MERNKTAIKIMFFNVNLGFAHVYTSRTFYLYPPPSRNLKFLEITLLPPGLRLLMDSSPADFSSG